MKETVNSIWEMPKEQLAEMIMSWIGAFALASIITSVIGFLYFRYKSKQFDKEWEEKRKHWNLPKF